MTRIVAGSTLAGVTLIGRSLARALGLVLGFVLLTACADKTIVLSYQAPPSAAADGPRLAILPFNDRRGKEGDEGDPLRVGGIYGGYGNRLVKVMATRPWPPLLITALVAEFRAAGVDAAAGPLPAAGDAFALDGDIRNFSTESRWGRGAHVSGHVQLKAPGGTALVQKRFEVRESGYNWNNFNEDVLQGLLNAAFAKFVRAVATDAEIQAGLRTRRAEPAPPVLPSSALEQELDRLAALKASGKITEEEYALLRRRLIEGASPPPPVPTAAPAASAPPRIAPAPPPRRQTPEEIAEEARRLRREQWGR